MPWTWTNIATIELDHRCRSGPQSNSRNSSRTVALPSGASASLRRSSAIRNPRSIMVPASGTRRGNRLSRFITNPPISTRQFVAACCRAIRESGSHDVVDLCSGGGGPWLSAGWRAARVSREWPLTVVVDRQIPQFCFKVPAQRSGETLRAVAESVDVTAVPAQLQGFRTIFASFHHFSDPVATNILEDAVRAGEGIGTAEVTSRTLKAMVIISFIPLLVL